MIKAENITKSYGKNVALNGLSCEIPGGCVYGLVGSNGAGKSTFLRLISGIYRPDGGEITVDGLPVYDNPEVKNRIAFVPDELYFLPRSTIRRTADLYAASYGGFSKERCRTLCETFGLDMQAQISTFSKGMKRQAAIILALATMPDFIFFDESFDGLDPVMRNLVKKAIYADVAERGTTAVIASHSLRELEDTCDQLALLHKGGIIFESDIQNLKTSLFKVQTAFPEDYDSSVFGDVQVLSFTKKGSVSTAIIRGDREKVQTTLKTRQPLLLDVLPLTLEEVFIYEMEALGYAFNDVLM